jgi:hypothetical protein
VKTGQTRANQVLRQLLTLDEGDRVNVLSIAMEYSDHPDINGHKNMPAGKRLLRQLEFGLSEVAQTKGEGGEG